MKTIIILVLFLSAGLLAQDRRFFGTVRIDTLYVNGAVLTGDGGVGSSSGLFEPDGNGDLMPNDAILPDDYYELDINGDIQPK